MFQPYAECSASAGTSADDADAVHRHGFLSACRLVSAAIPSGNAKPVLRNIKAIADGERCTFMATDLEFAVRLDVHGMRVSQPGQALLPSSRLIAILTESLDEDLHIEAGTNQITMRGLTNEFEMPADIRAPSPMCPRSRKRPTPRSPPTCCAR